MTTICSDGKTVAADGLVTADGFRQQTDAKKIIVENRVIYTLSGTVALFPVLIAWFKAGADPDKIPKTDCDWELMVIDRTGPRRYLRQLPYAEAQSYPFVSGSGREIALGALRHGATSRQAVERACEVDTRSGGDILVVDIAKALGLGPADEAPHQTYAPHPAKPGKFVIRQPARNGKPTSNRTMTAPTVSKAATSA